MAARLLTVGFGGQYTSETFTATDTAGADTIDCSAMDEISIQISSAGSPAGNIDINQTFNGSDYAVLDANVAVTDGTVVLHDVTDGPFGVLKIDPTDITNGTVVVTITGKQLGLR